MNRALVDRVVAAVLYEGYVLYPYRPSVKNRQRWTFGGIFPRAYCETQASGDAWMMQTDCLALGPAFRGIGFQPVTREDRLQTYPTMNVGVRFLHLVERSGGGSVPSWQEAVEREIVLDEVDLPAVVAHPRRRPFVFPASREEGGGVVREQQAINGTVEMSAEEIGAGLFKITVRIWNETPLTDADRISRDAAQLCSLVSTHTILTVRDGEFVSLIDPPAELRDAAAGCRNVGTWPVLVGEAGERDTLLSSPITLYDYPQVAPESPGDLFDCTEIDEILTLRVLTLTHEEKRAAAELDGRSRALLERTEALAREQLMGLHGTVRGLRPVQKGSADE
jgi:hydrogenase maturation protease